MKNKSKLSPKQSSFTTENIAKYTQLISEKPEIQNCMADLGSLYGPTKTMAKCARMLSTSD